MQCGTSHLQTVQENILSHIILGVITPNQIPLTTIVTSSKKVTEAEFQTIGPLYLHAVWYLPFTNSPRKHTVTYHFRCHYTKSNPIDDHSNIFKKGYRSRISNHWASIPACSVVPPIYKQSKKTYCHVYHFSDLQEVYSGYRQIHTKCQLQYFHPPHISTSGKCHCVIIHQTTKATEYIG